MKRYVFVILAAVMLSGCAAVAEKVLLRGGGGAERVINVIRGAVDRAVEERQEMNRVALGAVEGIERVLREEIPRLRAFKCKLGLYSELIEYAQRSEENRLAVLQDCQLDVSPLTVSVATPEPVIELPPVIINEAGKPALDLTGLTTDQAAEMIRNLTNDQVEGLNRLTKQEIIKRREALSE